jgi:methylated-DNA-protein-cysteine methyltransferase related protein
MQRICATVCEIPEGAVASYGQVAAVSGLPRGARQVGYALRNLPAGSAVPWHRVVTSSGKLAFERGSRNYRRQVRALLDENVPVIGGRVNMEQYGWQPDLDELLWKPSAAWDGT